MDPSRPAAKTIRPYGMWESPITPEILSKELRLEDPVWDSDESLVWLEGRSDQSTLVVLPPDGHAAHDLNDLLSARGGVGYGGAAFTAGGGWVYYVEAKTGRIYRQPTTGGSPAAPITPGFGACAALTLSPDGSRLLFIRSFEGRDSLEIVDSAGRQWPQILSAGDDFVMQPAWHPDGEQIAWVAWNHPNMPWDGSELRLGRLGFSPGGAASLLEMRALAGGEEISIFQPQFSPDGRCLAFASDESGWWQIFLLDLESGEKRRLTDGPAEHAEPAWVQGRRTFGFTPDSRRIIFLRNQNTVVSLWQVDLETRSAMPVYLDPEYTHLEQISVGAAGIALAVSGNRTPKRLIVRPLPEPVQSAAPDHARIVRRSTSEEFAPNYYSAPEAIHWDSENGETVYGLYYPPHHPRFSSSGPPPLIVAAHGGPTGQVHQSFNNETQYFTSRGWGVLWVNFRGSAGYGRKYRNRLWGNWGILDVEDSVAGARFMIASGRVDPKRLVILGGSSGGLVVLKALEDYPGFFKAGVCRYGVADQFALAADTHKFEARYSDRLIGPLPAAADLYRERSPIFFADQIRDPLALFQGEDDTSVPRSQMDAMAAELQRRGTPYVYHVYSGEGHGFRKPETIVHYYRAVNDFLLKHVLWT